MTLLVRPDNRKKNYQGLDELSAIEPPIFMALRAQVVPDPVIIDQELGDDFNGAHYDIEIFPSGSHPSSIYQKLGIAYEFMDRHGGLVWTDSPEFDISRPPAWEMFDLKKYRAHNWHCWGGKDRSGYAVMMTSFGCPYRCKFCSIRDFHRNKYGVIPLEAIRVTAEEISRQGVKNVKFVDEMFLFDEKRTRDICEILSGYDFNIWAYARADRINKDILKLLKSSGFNWLGIGIESGDEEIRKTVLKNSMTNDEIRSAIQKVKDEGINVGGNYMFGFPDDTRDTMRKTLDFAIDLKCEFTNMNPVMAFPGSEYYQMAIDNGWGIPDGWNGYSYYSYDCTPMGGHYLSPRDVISFRDDAFREFYSNESYLSHMRERFGDVVLKEISDMSSVNLRRKLLDEALKS